MEVGDEIRVVHENVPIHQFNRFSSVVVFQVSRRKRTGTQCCKCHHKKEERVRGLISSTTCLITHIVYAFLITTLISHLELKHQNKKDSPFETHPINMRAFFVTLCIYCFALAAKTMVTSSNNFYSRIFGHFNHIFGSLSSISLAAIFLSHWFSRLILVLGAFLPSIMVLEVLQKIYQWFHGRTTIAVFQLLNIFGRTTEEKMISTPPFQGVFKYLIPLLLTTLAVKFQGKEKDPFETHPINMWAYLIPSCTYYLVLGIMEETQLTNKFTSYSQIFNLVIMILGSLSSASLLSIFLPSLPGRLIFMAWGVFALFLARHVFQFIYIWLYNGTKKAISYGVDKINWIAVRLSQSQQLLPN